jgi:SAM-dependent MidA family methyltransferase
VNPLPWRQAWQQALYAPTGFYREELPHDHFQTACRVAPDLLGLALARLARRHGCTRVVDVGAGGADLLRGLAAADPDLQLVGVEVRPRPPGLSRRIGWADVPPPPDQVTLLVGWELLDVIPCPVLQADDRGGLRTVLVDRDGTETLGDRPDPDDLAWAARWWPGPYRPGQRVEVGGARDSYWAQRVAELTDGVALAVDYAHTRDTRPFDGSLTGYRRGRCTPAIADGVHDLTAHVAWDSLAWTVDTTCATISVTSSQREALQQLGIDGATPSAARAATDPAGYLGALCAAGCAGALLDPRGFGGFSWLVTVSGSAAEPAC